LIVVNSLGTESSCCKKRGKSLVIATYQFNRYV